MFLYTLIRGTTEVHFAGDYVGDWNALVERALRKVILSEGEDFPTDSLIRAIEMENSEGRCRPYRPGKPVGTLGVCSRHSWCDVAYLGEHCRSCGEHFFPGPAATDENRPYCCAHCFHNAKGEKCPGECKLCAEEDD